MGHQIVGCGPGSDEDNLSINLTRGAWQIVQWCDKFAPAELPKDIDTWTLIENMLGVTDLSEEAVKIADKMVPQSFEEAKANGLIYKGIDERDFTECRNFLRECAKRGYSVLGSY